jgi:hypothetical protein
MGIVDFSGTSPLSLFLTDYKYTKYLLQFHPPILLVLHISTPTVTQEFVLWNSRSTIEIRNINTHIIIWIDQWEMGPSFVLLHSVKLIHRKDGYVFDNDDKRYLDTRRRMDVSLSRAATTTRVHTMASELGVIMLKTCAYKSS